MKRKKQVGVLAKFTYQKKKLVLANQEKGIELSCGKLSKRVETFLVVVYPLRWKI